MCIPKKFLDDTDAAGHGTTLGTTVLEEMDYWQDFVTGPRLLREWPQGRPKSWA